MTRLSHRRQTIRRSNKGPLSVPSPSNPFFCVTIRAAQVVEIPGFGLNGLEGALLRNRPSPASLFYGLQRAVPDGSGPFRVLLH